VANLPSENGSLVGALVVDDDDEVLVIMERGKIVRSSVSEVRATGRTTQGVIFAKPDDGDRIIAVARNVERRDDDEESGASPEQTEQSEALPADQADEQASVTTEQS
jgi:DNA gyrase subunit A